MYRLRPHCEPDFERFVSGDFDVPPLLGHVLPAAAHPWSISPELAVLLYRLVTETKRTRLLEFGAGSSSMILATALAQRGGGFLTSIEENPEWCNEQWDYVTKVATVNAELVAARPQMAVNASGVTYVYKSAISRIEARGPFDLVLVDAPQYYYGRDGGLQSCYSHLSVGTILVLDDARRSGEQWAVLRWLRSYVGLELRLYDPKFGGKGVAVLEVTRPLRRRASGVALLSSSYHALQNWSKRIKRRRRMAASSKGGEPR